MGGACKYLNGHDGLQRYKTQATRYREHNEHRDNSGTRVSMNINSMNIEHTWANSLDSGVWTLDSRL